MAATFDSSTSSDRKPSNEGEEAVFATDGVFDLDAVGDGQPDVADYGPALAAGLLQGPATLDLESGSAPPSGGSFESRGRRGRDLARRAAAARPAPLQAPVLPVRRSWIAAAAVMVAVGLAVVVGVANRSDRQAAPALSNPTVAAAVAPPASAPPTPQAESAPLSAAASQIETPVAPAAPEHPAPVPMPRLAEAAPPPSLAAPPPPALTAPAADAPSQGVEFAQSPDAGYSPSAIVPNCRIDPAPDACWASQLAEAQHLLVQAHLNARLAGVPMARLRAGFDDWHDAAVAARASPEAQLDLIDERRELVGDVVATYADDLARGLESPTAPPSLAAPTY